MDAADTGYRDGATRWVQRIGIPAFSLIAANAGLAVIYFLYDLTLFQLVLVYWWECLWIGLFSALKLLVASLIGDPYRNRYISSTAAARLLLSVVLIVFVSSTFGSLLGLTGMMLLWAGEALPGSGADDRAIRQIGLIIGSSLLFLVSHGIAFVVNFLVLGEFRHVRVTALLALPFKRTFALFAFIAAAIGVVVALPSLASATGLAAIVIVVKLLSDLLLDARERRALARIATSGEAH